MIGPSRNAKTFNKILRYGGAFYGVGLVLTIIGVILGLGSPSSRIWLGIGIAVMAVYGLFTLIALLVLKTRDEVEPVKRNDN